MGVTALGVDPGGTSGLFLGMWRQGERKPYRHSAWECDMATTPELLRWILRDYGHLIQAVQVEAFDNRERSRKMRGFSASNMHKLITELELTVLQAGLPVPRRVPPAPVKDWANARRIEAAGLKTAVGKMTDDALMAACHCLYCACKDLGLRDPLSRTGQDRARAPG